MSESGVRGLIHIWWTHFRPFLLSAAAFLLISYLTAGPLFAFIDRTFASTDDAGSFFNSLAIFIAALLKTVFLVSLVFPGLTILVVAFTSVVTTLPSAVHFVTLVWLGIQMGCAFNYAAGRYLQNSITSPKYSKYLDRARSMVRRFGRLAIVVCAFHPNLIGDFFTLQGVLGLSFLKAFLLQSFMTSLALTVYALLLPRITDLALIGGISVTNHYVYVSAAILLVGLAYATWRSLK